MLKLCAAGDVILMDQLPEGYAAMAQPIIDYVNQSDVKIANLETTLSHFDCFASTYCGTPWLTTEPETLDQLKPFGFQFYGFANNHSMDYSYGGLLSTLQALDQRGLAHSGAGEDLTAATRPGVVETVKGSVGILSVTSTSDDSARAGDPKGPIPGRPGLNMLRRREVYNVSPAHMAALKEIAAATCINGRLDNSRAGGYTPVIPGCFGFGTTFFREQEPEGKETVPHEGDCQRILNAIKEAKQTLDYMVVYLHTHEIAGLTDDTPDYFVEEFAHRCVDAGACAFFCSGTHQVKAVELYHGAPIFYSIANFMFQYDHTAWLPQDFYEKYKVPAEYDTKAAFDHLSQNNTRGLTTERHIYLALCPTLELENGKVTGITIQPLDLCFDQGDPIKGLPVLADDATSRKIFDRLTELSKPYGTKLAYRNGQISVEL